MILIRIFCITLLIAYLPSNTESNLTAIGINIPFHAESCTQTSESFLLQKLIYGLQKSPPVVNRAAVRQQVWFYNTQWLH